MALYYKNPNSFEEVEALYNSIKPLGGSKNKGKDIRPAGDRRRNGSVFTSLRTTATA